MTEKITTFYNKGRVIVSFELFPPKTSSGFDALSKQIDDLISCNPSFITCTYGAGGSTRNKTLEVLAHVQQAYPEIPVASHLTCVGSTVDELKAFLSESQHRKINTIVALRGDPPLGEKNFTPPPGGLRYANELVALIKKEFPHFGILVAGYPEKHPEAPSFDIDLENLKRKIDAGGEAVITQLFFDNEDFYRFRERCDKSGITVPVVPGILPVINLKQIKRFTALCGSRLTDKLLRRLEAHGDDEEGQYSVGIYYAARQVEELVENGGVPGVHFYVLNRSRAVGHICRALNLSTPGNSST